MRQIGQIGQIVKEEYISDIKLVSLSDFKKGKPIEMTKEQFDSWTGNKNENEI